MITGVIEGWLVGCKEGEEAGSKVGCFDSLSVLLVEGHWVGEAVGELMSNGLEQIWIKLQVHVHEQPWLSQAASKEAM